MKKTWSVTLNDFIPLDVPPPAKTPCGRVCLCDQWAQPQSPLVWSPWQRPRHQGNCGAAQAYYLYYYQGGAKNHHFFHPFINEKISNLSISCVFSEKIPLKSKIFSPDLEAIFCCSLWVHGKVVTRVSWQLVSTGSQGWWSEEAAPWHGPSLLTCTYTSWQPPDNLLAISSSPDPAQYKLQPCLTHTRSGLNPTLTITRGESSQNNILTSLQIIPQSPSML